MRKGFTLIELLVVIAIIAILAAILFPVFGKAREKARQTHCTNNQKQFATATTIYIQEHEETLPPAETFWGDIRIDKAALRCTTAPSLDNGYLYNQKVAGKGQGAIREGNRIKDADTIWLTCDGKRPTNQVNNMFPLANVAYHTDDFTYRHNQAIIVSYLDGHAVLRPKAEFEQEIQSEYHDYEPPTDLGSLGASTTVMEGETLIYSTTSPVNWTFGNFANGITGVTISVPAVSGNIVNTASVVAFTPNGTPTGSNNFTITAGTQTVTVTVIPPLDTDLVAHWPLENTTAIVGPTLTLEGTTLPTFTAGKYSNALTQGASGSPRAKIGDSLTLLSGATGVSITGWVKVNSIGTEQHVIVFGTTAATAESICGVRVLTDGTLRCYARSQGGQSSASVQTTSTISGGTWAFFAQTIDYTKSINAVSLYVNSAAPVTNTSAPGWTAPTTCTTAPLLGYIGCTKAANTTLYTQGQIDEVRVYNRALSAAEVAYIRDHTP